MSSNFTLEVPFGDVLRDLGQNLDLSLDRFDAVGRRSKRLKIGKPVEQRSANRFDVSGVMLVTIARPQLGARTTLGNAAATRNPCRARNWSLASRDVGFPGPVLVGERAFEAGHDLISIRFIVRPLVAEEVEAPVHDPSGVRLSARRQQNREVGRNVTPVQQNPSAAQFEVAGTNPATWSTSTEL